jgi:hypothetical protein
MDGCSDDAEATMMISTTQTTLTHTQSQDVKLQDTQLNL